jgi:hypothetical protein
LCLPQIAFMQQIIPVLEAMPFLERYAWFALPPDQIYSGDTTSLYNSNGTPTQTGAVYRTY